MVIIDWEMADIGTELELCRIRNATQAKHTLKLFMERYKSPAELVVYPDEI